MDLETNNKAALEEVGQNADLYIANQEDVNDSSGYYDAKYLGGKIL